MVNDLNIRTGTQPVPSRSAAAAVNPAHLILNPASGSTALLLRKLARVARERGIRVRVLGTGEDAGRAALAAADDGAQSLAVAGGDGSVAAVAAVAAERGLPLAVVPTGTLNHFARDLGLDLARPLRALDAFDAGHERRVNVGRVNGRPFINNVSLGIYTRMLSDPGYRRETPLRFSVDPGGLRLLVPDGPPVDRQVPSLEAGWRAARTLHRWLSPTPPGPAVR